VVPRLLASGNRLTPARSVGCAAAHRTRWISSICTRWRSPTTTPFVANTSQAALAQALTERPDAIVLDVLMPGDDGFTTCGRLQDHPVTAAIPVLLLTASDAVDVEARATQAGATAALHKPCSASD